MHYVHAIPVMMKKELHPKTYMHNTPCYKDLRANLTAEARPM